MRKNQNHTSASTRKDPPRGCKNGSVKPINIIHRTDMVATVLQDIKTRILAGQFGEDGVLPSEGDLARSYGVSRTVIREAMRGLRGQGLVEVSQGRAPRVKPVDSQTVISSLTTLLRRGGGTLLNLLEVRRPLETEMAALAAERSQPEDIAKLEETIVELGRASTLEKKIQIDGCFHRILAETARNPIFGLLMDTVSGLLHESRVHTISHSGVDIVIRHHTKILDEVRHHNVEGARKAMMAHLTMAQKDLEEEIAATGR
jgi:GntR family transcriptional repressor for pyruvate dehydrogenase complex